MANVRRLKKDVDYLMFAIVADSLNIAVRKSDKTEEIGKIVEEALHNRNSLRSRISEGRRVEKSGKKKHYRAVFSDLLKLSDASFTQLSEMVKK